MILGGGAKLPAPVICALGTAMAILACSFVYSTRGISALRLVALFLALEGSVLLAGAFSPMGTVPEKDTLLSEIKWLFSPQRGVPVEFSPLLYFGGLLMLFVGSTLAALN